MPKPRVVLKFGGTSVSSLDRWRTILRLVRDRQAEGLAPMVVCSAVTGISNLLDRLLPDAILGRHGGALATIRGRHTKLARDMAVPIELIEGELAELERIASGVALLGEFTPRLRARVMASGELMITRLGAAWLSRQGLGAEWHDAREFLQSTIGPNDARHYLAASCRHDRDASVNERLGDAVVLTQGFIARDVEGRTVLLGRGGSDTSGAYLAAIVGAARLEIWTDVPGMYTADPRVVPHARLLRRLTYAEAQELAAMGAKVLHPRCIGPVAASGIPLWIRATPAPDSEGTVLSPEASPSPGVRALAARAGILLLSIETLGMWQEAGFLARVFSALERHGLSVDHVATGESNVTVSLDTLANALDPRVLDAATAELRLFAEVKVIGPCAAVSLVGCQVRSVLHELGPALEAFAEMPIHLVSQAANDLAITFIVDVVHADRLLLSLHQRLLDNINSPELGNSWQVDEPVSTPWTAHRDALLALAGGGTPVYVHDLSRIRSQAQKLRMLPLDRVFFAMKACPLPEVVATVAQAGLGIECVSAGEMMIARRAVPGVPLLFTPNFAPRSEYETAFDLGAIVTLDGTHPLTHWPDLLASRQVVVRVDPGTGRGHHRHVRTAGSGSKFGIPIEELPAFVASCTRAQTQVVGLHAHVGSGVLDVESWLDTARLLFGLCDILPHVRSVDLGGGLAVPYRARDAHFDLAGLGYRLAELKAAAPAIELWMEPGRWVVAEAGCLLVRVTQLKQRGGRCIVGVDGGMNALLRPALYGAWHAIENLSRPSGPTVVVDIVGPICESADVLGQARSMVQPQEGDVLLIHTAGAYGIAMSNTYNSRALPRNAYLPA